MPLPLPPFPPPNRSGSPCDIHALHRCLRGCCWRRLNNYCTIRTHIFIVVFDLKRVSHFSTMVVVFSILALLSTCAPTNTRPVLRAIKRHMNSTHPNSTHLM